MASIAFRNSSRRLLRAYFSKLGWQANVIWRIAFFNQLQVYPSWLWRSDLFRASLVFETRRRITKLGVTIMATSLASVSLTPSPTSASWCFLMLEHLDEFAKL